MKLAAMESLAESKAQKWASLIDDDESPKSSKKRRSSGSDTLQYLREKAENDSALNRQLLEFQRQEMAMHHAVSIDSKTVIANDGHNAAVITKQAVNTCM